MKVDIHVHTSKYSECAKADPTAMVQAAVAAGLDGIVLTEHNYLWSKQELEDLQQRHPEIKLFRGIEVSITIDEHVIVLGVLDESLLYPYMRPAELMDVVRRHSGAAILAHPYRWSDSVSQEIIDAGFDGIEINSTSIRQYARKPILELHRQCNCPLVAASDGHVAEVMGMYAIELEEDARDEQELAGIVREGKFSMWKNEKSIEAANGEIIRKQRKATSLIQQGMDTREALVSVGLSRNLRYAVENELDIRYLNGY